MAAVEDRMWWYRALHALLLRALEDHPGARGAPLLDAGCGTGGFLRRAGAAWPARARLGIEYHPAAAGVAQARSGALLCVGSINDLPMADRAAGAVVSADVLCHRAVEVERALGEFRRVLAPGGVLVLNLPAFQWLYSAHDRAVHTARRYTRAEVEAMLATAGFRPLSVRYWNALLFPLMLLQRKVLARNAAASDVRPFPAVIEAAFGAVTTLERRLMRLGLAFPFGGSVLAVAENP